MLGLAKIRQDKELYYLELTSSHSTDRTGLIEADGYWLGHGASELGLSDRPVDQMALQALFSGFDPVSGEQLNVGHQRVLNVAIDCMFAAPKSVSILHALGEAPIRDQVRLAHDVAVGAGISYLERNAAFVRRGSRPSTVVRANGYVASGFCHRVSRSQDPHLHSHVLVTNLGRGDDGRWTTLDARAIYLHVRAAGSLYDAQLRHELTVQLGARWHRLKSGTIEVLGISTRAVSAFSRRQGEIAQELRLRGQTSSGYAQFAALGTKSERVKTMSYLELQSVWRQRANEHGIALDNLHGSDISSTNATSERRKDWQSRDLQVAQTIGTFDRSFTREQLIVRLCSDLLSGASAQHVESEIAEALHVQTAQEKAKSWNLWKGKRFPLGFGQSTFIETTLKDRDAASRSRIGGAPTLDLDHCSSNVEVPLGLFRLELDRLGGLGSLLTLSQLAPLVKRLHRSMVVIARSRSDCAHIEAWTAIPAQVDGLISRGGSRSVVVLWDSPRLSPEVRAKMVERAVRHELTVISITNAKELDGFLDQKPPRAVVFDPPVVASCGEMEVYGCTNIPQMLSFAHRYCEQLLADEKPVAIVAHKAVLEDLNMPAISPHDIPQVLRQEPQTRVIVLGGARLLGHMVESLSDDQRVHIGMIPSGRLFSFDRWPVEFSEPSFIRQQIGPFPATPVERMQWGDAAIRLSNRQETDGQVRLARRADLAHVPAISHDRSLALSRNFGMHH